MSKRKNRTIDKRRVRRKEKNSRASHDLMLGRVCRRGWGKGIPH